jgi:hypothetical protein
MLIGPEAKPRSSPLTAPDVGWADANSPFHQQRRSDRICAPRVDRRLSGNLVKRTGLGDRSRQVLGSRHLARKIHDLEARKASLWYKSVV